MFAQITPRSIAKDAVTYAVGLQVTDTSRDFLDKHTDINQDAIAVKAGTWTLGQAVAWKVSAYTDKAVDDVADAMVRVRDRIRNKKSAQ